MQLNHVMCQVQLSKECHPWTPNLLAPHNPYNRYISLDGGYKSVMGLWGDLS